MKTRLDGWVKCLARGNRHYVCFSHLFRFIALFPHFMVFSVFLSPQRQLSPRRRSAHRFVKCKQKLDAVVKLGCILCLVSDMMQDTSKHYTVHWQIQQPFVIQVFLLTLLSRKDHDASYRTENFIKIPLIIISADSQKFTKRPRPSLILTIQQSQAVSDFSNGRE